MRNSRLVAIFALFLALAYAFPAFCVSAPSMPTTAHPTSTAPCGGCHGHRQHMPAPPRYCCANHQAPAALQASTSPVPLQLIGCRAPDQPAHSPDSCTTISINRIEFSPPPPAVLRI
jgi:hypothetical protein